MLMRYYWGLAIGNIYTHRMQRTSNISQSPESLDKRTNVTETGGKNESDWGHVPAKEATNKGLDGSGDEDAPVQANENITEDLDGSEDADAEFGLESRDLEDWPQSSDSEKEDLEELNSEDDEHITAMEEMYNYCYSAILDHLACQACSHLCISEFQCLDQKYS